MRRVLWLLVLLALLVGGFFAWRTWRANAAESALANLQTVELARGPLTAMVGATGTVRANQAATLTFETTGTVEKVTVETGDPVFAGQILVTLEETSLPSQIILARADLAAAEKALDDLLNSELARAQAQLNLAKARDALQDAEYRWRVQQPGNRASGEVIAATQANLVLAEEEVRQAEREYNRVAGRPEDDPVRALARARLAEARQKRDSILRQLNWYTGKPTDIDQAILDAELALAQAQLAEAEREWERLKDGPDPRDVAAAEARIAAARATLEMARVRAPFSGTVTFVSVKPGDQVSPGTVALSLADLSHLLVDVEVTEVDINRIKVGQEVTLILDAAPDRTYHGVVVEVGLAGVERAGVVNFPVTVEITDADELVRPGMTAAVNIIVEQIEDVLLIPNRAVRVREGERVVYVLRGGVPQPVPVVLGASSETHSQLLEGDLRPGDRIVLNPPAQFEDNGPFPFGGGR